MYFSKLLVSDIVDFAVSNGADKLDLFQRLAMDLGDKIDPMDHVSYEKMVSTLNLVGQTIDDDFLGLHLGDQLMLKGTQQVDEIMKKSATIDEAFGNAINYGRLISDALQSSMEKSAERTKVSFDVNPNWQVQQSHAVRQIIDMTLVCTMKSIYWLTGKKYTPKEIHLTYPAMKGRSEYYKVFDCRVKFNESTPRIIFHSPVLDLPIPTADGGLLASLKKVGNEELEQLQSEHPLILQIQKAVLTRLPQKSTMQLIAPTLHLSSRTLQRRLKQLNTSFKQIEKEILINLAKKLILFENRNIEEVSYLLGFSEASTFIRFFRNAEQITPSKYKKKHIRT